MDSSLTGVVFSGTHNVLVVRCQISKSYQNLKCLDEGNCVLYDNNKFTKMFHGVNGFFQIFAIIFAGICYWLSKSVKLPEEMEMSDFPETREMEYRDRDDQM